MPRKKGSTRQKVRHLTSGENAKNFQIPKVDLTTWVLSLVQQFLEKHSRKFLPGPQFEVNVGVEYEDDDESEEVVSSRRDHGIQEAVLLRPLDLAVEGVLQVLPGLEASL